MSDQTTGRRRRTSPLDDDDLLGEILLRLPPKPSSLARVSLVCKQWRRLVSDPCFIRGLRAHHRKPPLLGFFERRVVFSDDFHQVDVNDFMFEPILEHPDRIPPQRFSLGLFPAGAMGSAISLLDCRDGRVLLTEYTSREVLLTLIVCDPVISSHVRFVVPPEFIGLVINGTVLCAAGEKDHVHGTCHCSPFKVVLVAESSDNRPPMTCVYSSETGRWGNVIQHDLPEMFTDLGDTSTLIAHALYWTIVTYGSEEVEDDGVYIPRPHDLLEFDLDRQTLTVMKGPPMEPFEISRIIKAMDGGVGFATLSYPTLQSRLWRWNVNGRDVATWVLVNTVDLHNIFGLDVQEHERFPVTRRRFAILGYDVDNGVIFIQVDSCLFILQLDSMQFKRRYESTETRLLSICLPFRSFYPAGAATAVRSDGG